MRRITLAAFVGIMGLSALATGCLDRSPGAVCPVPTEIATTRQTANDFDGVDLLVVVDNSSSMTEEQAILSTGFFTLINSLSLPLQNDPDWTFPAVDNIRVAVVSSDMGLQYGEAPGQILDPPTIKFDGCDGRGDNGGFQQKQPSTTTIPVAHNNIRCEPDGGQCPAGYTCTNGLCAAPDPTRATVNCDAINNTANYLETTADNPNGNLTTQVACTAQLGKDGCGVEQQLEAGVRGLANNPDFMHPTHLLAVLVVSDEEDCSIKDSGLFNTPEWTSGVGGDGLLNTACNYPVGNEQYLFETQRYNEQLIHLKNDQPAAVIFAAIVGVPTTADPVNNPGPCQGTGDLLEQNACLGAQEMQLSLGTFEDAATGTEYQHFNPACTREAGGVEVTSARPGRRYVDVAQQFGPRGYVYSICNADWAPAMKNIAEIIARQITATCYPKQLDWSLESGNIGRAKCDVVVEIVRTGESLKDESCPAQFYDWLPPNQQKAYADQKTIDVEKSGGVITKKTILCPLPKLATPKECDGVDGADQYVLNMENSSNIVGWYYCEKSGESFDDACKDGIDNDGDGALDCADSECTGCTVCGGDGVACEDGCRYGVQITDRAKRVSTGNFLSVQCLQRFSFEDQNCQEDTQSACSNGEDDDGNGIYDCNNTLYQEPIRDKHLADPHCCKGLVLTAPGVCAITDAVRSAVRGICPVNDSCLVQNGAAANAQQQRTCASNNWALTDIGACQARARELGCVLGGATPNDVNGNDTGGGESNDTDTQQQP